MRGILESAGVTVLEGTVRTTVIKGVEIDFCGIDDPTYMADEEWLGQLASVAAAANPSRLRVLLSHRPEYSGAYADYDFDLICSGHLHGGQWGIPGLGLGVCGPSSGGPAPSERLLFPRRAGGAYRLNDTTTMVVSRGLARESTPLPRFFNHPELVVIDVKPR
jgi:predicted MPP superfamily phosphohydrolase